MNELLKDADICVKCGLCLPHCPTYRQTRNENWSPRGRIALIQAWAGGQLELSSKLLAHLDNCLLCRSCERVCPALVPYGRLLDHFRGQIKSRRRFALAPFLLKKIARNKTLNRWAQSGLTLYQAGSRQAPLTQNFFAAASKPTGDVGLFTGCMGALLDNETVNASVQCLTAAGFNVHIPDRQTCCGALDQHRGDIETASELAEGNCRAFAEHDLQAIVTIASGCGGHLQEYQDAGFAAKVVDISRFLSLSGQELAGKLRPLPAKACLHTPCSLKNVMREEEGALKLLRLLPGLEIVELPETIQCCGAAGSYMLEHPEMAKALLGELLAAATPAQAEYLATSNIGCALHIAAGLAEMGVPMEVIHPVTLIARQLD